MTLRKALIISVIIHLLILYIWIWCCMDKKTQNIQVFLYPQQEYGCLPNEEGCSMFGDDLEEKGDKEGIDIEIIPKDEFNDSDDECENWYGGVGIYYAGNEVTKVSLGYPAYKVGIRKGDIILNIDELRGEPGTKTTAEINRPTNNGNEYFQVSMVREKICYVQ